MLSYLLVALFAVALTLVLRRAIKMKVLLVVVAALTTGIAFQILAYLQLNYLDPFFLIAFVLSTLLAAVASTLTVIFLAGLHVQKNLNG